MMSLSPDYREPRSWRGLLDRCLEDRERYWRLVLLIVVMTGVVFSLEVFSGWPLAGMSAVAASVVVRFRRRP